MSETSPLLQPCPNCATLVDISDEEPLAQVHCPICGTTMRVRTQFNNFEIEEILGAGGMGAVYRANDRNLDRPVALKLLRKEYSQDREYIEKFEREARITASINHPSVVKVFAFGLDHGLVYMAMELVDNGSLDELITLQTRVSESQVLDVGIQVAQGLQAAHNKGLIHRDVKPGNILFADAHTAKITDFGLAILMEHEAEARGEVWGTPYYVAPEKLSKEPEDFRSDIYSLGGTLFHALAGRPPFEAETASLVALKHIKSRVVSLQAFAPDVSSATAFVINRMLKQHPHERYQSYDELLEHLNYARVKVGNSKGAPKKRARVVLKSKSQEKIMTLLTLATLLALLVGGLVLFLMRDSIFGEDERQEMVADERLAQVEQKLGHSRERYDAARRLMMNGEFGKAAGGFKELVGMEGVPQPLANWALFHYGLTELMIGNEESARQAFAKLSAQGHFSNEPIDKPLVRFFEQSGTILADDKPVARSALNGLDLTGVDAIGVMAYGLKNLALGDLADGIYFLERFDRSEPSRPFEWIGAYRILGRMFLNDAVSYQSVLEALSRADALEAKSAVLEKLDTARKTLKTKGKIAFELDALQRQLTKEIASLEAQQTETSTVRKEKDEAAMAELKPPYEKAIKQHDFDRALKLAEATDIGVASLKQERDAMVQKARWLSEFKAWLLKEIRTVGFTGRFGKRNGGVVPGEVRSSTEEVVTVSSPYGSVEVPWTDVAPATVLAMAIQFIETNPNAADVPDRYWQAGVFAIMEGLPKPGRALLMKAAQLKGDYNNDLELFFESDGAN